MLCLIPELCHYSDIFNSVYKLKETLQESNRAEQLSAASDINFFILFAGMAFYRTFLRQV